MIMALGNYNDLTRSGSIDCIASWNLSMYDYIFQQMCAVEASCHGTYS
jgi:hypothetical protein